MSLFDLLSFYQFNYFSHNNPIRLKNNRNKEAGRNKFKYDIDFENERMAKKLAQIKGMYDFDKSVLIST
jgi:hypothetical protein